MHRLCAAAFVVTFLFFAQTPRRISFDGLAQGTTYHIVYFADDSLVQQSQVDSVLSSLDSSLSLYKSYSLINRFNRSSHGSAADLHLRRVVKRSLEINRDTRGIFDITIGPLTVAWGFGPDRVQDPPDSARVSMLKTCVGSTLLKWRGKQLLKKKPCVQLDPNGIAQGYTVDVLATFFESRGVYNYVIELGGEIRLRGKRLPQGTKLTVGIEAPGDDPDFSLIEKVVSFEQGAITTSGNYRRYYNSNGRKITHLIDGRSGYPVSNELISVTVFANDAMTADGYDNALMAMGLRDAISFVEHRPQLAAHFIYRRPDGGIADTMSSRFRALVKE